MASKSENKKNLGNAMWMIIFLAAVTSPFWGHWHFLLGAVLMAIACELRS